MLSATLLVALGFSLTPIIIVTRTYFIVHPDTFPSRQPSEPVLEKQTESFTCGVHALSTVYRAYGLDPERERIRWRLGVDTKAVFWARDTTGALHPDFFMVLNQDYFQIDSLDLEGAGAWRDLLAHLDSGHLAILLIKRRQNGNLHWVTATRHLAGQIEVYDSLFPDPYLEPEEFLTNHLVTALLLEPSTPSGLQLLGSLEAHRIGARDLLRAKKRTETLK